MRWRNRYSSGIYAPLNEDYLRQRYILDKKSTIQIGNELGCSHMKVVRYLKHYGVKARNRGEAIHLAQRKEFELTQDCKNYIDGLLMGDGSVSLTSKWSGYYIQGVSMRYRPWTQKIKQDFERFGIESKADTYDIKERCYIGYKMPPIELARVLSKSYVTFCNFRERWYPNGKKVFPKDIQFTAQTLANWYMGDGSRSKRQKQVMFATPSRSQRELDFILSKFKREWGYNPKMAPKKPNGYDIRLNKKDAEDFLKRTLPFKVSCFDYKWIEDPLEVQKAIKYRKEYHKRYYKKNRKQILKQQKQHRAKVYSTS